MIRSSFSSTSVAVDRNVVNSDMDKISTVASISDAISDITEIKDEVVVLSKFTDSVDVCSSNIDDIIALNNPGMHAFGLKYEYVIENDGVTEILLNPQISGLSPTSIDVYVDGLKLNSSSFTTDGSNKLIFTEITLSSNQLVAISANKEYDVADVYTKSDTDLAIKEHNVATEIVYDCSADGLGASSDCYDVQSAISALDAAVKINTAKETNTVTDLSWDAVNSTIVSSDGENTVITIVDEDNDGLMTASDKSKLDGIEIGATTDQTDTEIETAYNNIVSIATDEQIKDDTDDVVYRVTPKLVNSAISKQVDALSDGQVTTNKDSIGVLNADSGTTGSVDEKIKTQVTDKLVDNVVDGGSTSYLSAEQGKVLDEKITVLKTVTAIYKVENDGDTVFALANNTDEPLVVELEGFILYEDEYTRDADGITLNDGADKNAQVYIVAYNG